jgi:hypothetical protein
MTSIVEVYRHWPTREAWLEWCKTRSREYMARGDYNNAVVSMLSDLTKHPDWQSGKLIAAMAMLWAIDPSPRNAERIIEGFN